MTRQDDRNGLHVGLVDALVLERSDFPGAFRRGLPVTLALDEGLDAVSVTRGDGKVVIARLKEGAETSRIFRFLQAGKTLTGKIEEVMVEPFATTLRIRLDQEIGS